MFISRIPLNKVRYGARQLIGSPYKLHAAVEAAFPPDAVRRTMMDEFCGDWTL